MAYQNFLIAPFTEGLQKDVEPWLIMDNAFSVMNNCFLHNGFVKKKFGYRLLGRLQKQVTGAAAAGTGVGPYTATLTGPVAPGTVKIYDGASLDGTDGGTGTFAASTTIASGTINYLTGAVSVTYTVAGTPAGAVTFSYDYCSLQPVMGILQRETIYDNRETTVVFDKNDAYEWNGSKFVTTTTANHSWTGEDYNFFQGCTYYYDGSNNRLFWVTNNKAYSLAGGTDNRDGIKYYNGTSWATLRPLTGAATYLDACLIILPFKGRLIALRTQETSVTYYQRARWCQPNAVPTGASAWRSDLIGYGGYVDAATAENIVAAQLLGDRLLVFFERSTWELFYTGIKEQPFTFRKISDEYGCKSTNSLVEQGNRVFSVGDKAITVCDGNSIQKIDAKLDQDIFDIHNLTNAKARVHGVVDDLYKLIYWTIPTDDANWPEKMIVYNYENGSFSYFDDGFTALGYYQPTADYTWSTIGKKWSEIGMRWSALISKGDTKQIIAGNQQGFVEQFYFWTINDPSLHIAGFTVGTNTITVSSTNHNLDVEEGIDVYLKFNNVCGISATYGGVAVEFSNLTFKLASVTDANTFVVDFPVRTDGDATIKAVAFTGTYTGGGTIAKMFNFNLTTKKFNPLVKEGKQLKIGYVDLYTNATTSGQISLNFIVDDVDYQEPSSRFVKSIVDFPTSRQYGQLSSEKYFNRALINSRGQFLQLKMNLSDSQMLTSAYRDVPFELHSINLWLAKAGKWIGLS